MADTVELGKTIHLDVTRTIPLEVTYGTKETMCFTLLRKPTILLSCQAVPMRFTKREVETMDLNLGLSLRSMTNSPNERFSSSVSPNAPMPILQMSLEGVCCWMSTSEMIVPAAYLSWKKLPLRISSAMLSVMICIFEGSEYVYFSSDH